MTITIDIHGKPVRVALSPAAIAELGQRGTPLVAELEIYFSCLVRKKVRFHAAAPHAGAVPVSDGLYVRFRPVMTRHCRVDDTQGEPPLTDFPIVKARPFVPHWLLIDYRSGQWMGEFGYDLERAPAALHATGEDRLDAAPGVATHRST